MPSVRGMVLGEEENEDPPSTKSKLRLVSCISPAQPNKAESAESISGQLPLD